MENSEKVLILTLWMDQRSQAFFDLLRLEHFPPERNFLKAHLTLFHKLPDLPEIIEQLSALSVSSFKLNAIGLINLGAGVAFRMEAQELTALRAHLASAFSVHLSPQDKQGFRGHVTVQNKTSPEIARALLAELSDTFKPFEVEATGLDLWYYLGGPWEHKQFFPFI
ncbi:2'-5' RNA ligase family protein [Pedobacter duraquae]|uniref:2'-5' RNA ligase superfamily protein n=1 Tax=Pedobacter duraquae TaxID=425511 RepID=A0A4R6IAS9_9SPHI|nr:2'-5' RNA ligase family protein [Pedobacter duraquae]TDO19323.1 2'-5' RNA ligase superfamily protein [Pedobacter duraquae]